MDELNKQNVEEESAAVQPGGESAQPVPPADTGAQQTQQTAEPAGESAPAPETQLGKLICPRCGNAFDPKEKKCPHCGMKNDLKLCKTCGATIAKNAKRCPKCGAKNKKPIYKRVSFWVSIVVLLLIVSCSTTNSGETAGTSDLSASTTSEDKDIVVGEWIGEIKLDQANSNGYYLDESQNIRMIIRQDHTMSMQFGDEAQEFNWALVGETGDVRQYKITEIGNPNGSCIYFRHIAENNQEYEDFAGKILVTSGDNLVIYGRKTSTGSSSKNTSTSSANTTGVSQKSRADMNISSGKKNALEQAYSYLNAMAFSYSGLIEQLEYEGYSTEEATYAVDNCGADWKEQAAKKAEEYLNSMSFSKSGLIEQLEYEGFTHDQAAYGADQA